MTGLNLMDKTLAVRGARLAFNIWDVAGTLCIQNFRCRHQTVIAFGSSIGFPQLLLTEFFLVELMDAGDSQSIDHVPIACKDAVAILFMFDLTSRCTLNKLVYMLIKTYSR